MGLKQDIVIKCDFTNNQHKGHGKTPGQFLDQYVARDNATEASYPTHEVAQNGLDNFIDNYVGRQNATETAEAKNYTAEQLQESLQDSAGKNGRCFGNESLSLSEKELYQHGQKIQRLFDEGHSVQKLVISFKTDYLKQRGIIDPNYVHNGPGSLFGQVDQMKLRHAINDGLQTATKAGGFTNPVWAGAVQVNTNHVHAHVVLADDVELSQSKRLKTLRNGTTEEAGKFTDQNKTDLRRKLDRDLLDQKQLHRYHDEVSTSRGVTVGLVKQLTTQQAISNGQLQQVQGALPTEKVLWKANTKSPKMQRANQLMDDYVDTLINNYGSEIGYDKALQKIQNYADNRSTSKDMNTQYVENGVRQLRTQIKNGIYETLKHQKQHELQPKTTYQKYTSQNTQHLKYVLNQANLKNEDRPELGIVETAYRQQAYPQRLRQHLDESHVYQTQLDRFDNANQHGQVNSEAQVMRPFYKSELKYHRDLVDKYRQLTPKDSAQLQQKRTELRPEQQELHAKRQALLAQGQKEGLWTTPAHVDQAAQQLRNITLQKLQTTHDDDVNRALNHGIDINGRASTVRDQLQKLQQQPQLPLDEQSAQILNTLGTTHPQYQNVGTQLRGSTATKDIEPSMQFEQAATDYCNRTSVFTRKGFDAGIVTSDQVIDPSESYTKLMQSLNPNDVVDVDNIFNAGPTQAQHHFDQVKNKDLDVLGDDFTPNMNRHVSDKNAAGFENTIDQRSQAVDGAMNYIENSHQQAEAIAALQAHVKRQKELAKRIKEQHELIVEAQQTEDDAQTPNQSLETFNYQASSDYNQNNLVEIRHQLQRDIQPRIIEGPQVKSGRELSQN